MINHSGCLLSQILFHCFVCLCICIFFLFYNPTLSLLCMFQSYNENPFCAWMAIILLFYMTEHIYSVFCIQNQGSTKNVYANLSGNLYGATYFFLARFARLVFKTLIKCTIRHKHKSILVLLFRKVSMRLCGLAEYIMFLSRCYNYIKVALSSTEADPGFLEGGGGGGGCAN